jgi:hypothetical protein
LLCVVFSSDNYVTFDLNALNCKNTVLKTTGIVTAATAAQGVIYFNEGTAKERESGQKQTHLLTSSVCSNQWRRRFAHVLHKQPYRYGRSCFASDRGSADSTLMMSMANDYFSFL